MKMYVKLPKLPSIESCAKCGSKARVVEWTFDMNYKVIHYTYEKN